MCASEEAVHVAANMGNFKIECGTNKILMLSATKLCFFGQNHVDRSASDKKPHALTGNLSFHYSPPMQACNCGGGALFEQSKIHLLVKV